MSGRIHLNSAGAGLPAPGVVEVMTRYLDEEAERGPYETEAAHAAELEGQVYAAVAGLLNAPADEVALFGSATDAWARIVCHLDLPPGSRIWTTPYEYAGSLIGLQNLARRLGSTVEVVPTRPDGDLDLAWMRRNLDDRVGLVSMVHVPSGVGIVLPVQEVGALLAGSGAVYAVDACQSVGQLPVDVAAIGCHVLSGAGRKFLRGPRGTGFAYVSRSIWDRVHPPFHDLHVAEVESLTAYRVTADRAARFETSERNGAVVVGLLTALEFAGPKPVGAAPEVLGALLDAVAELPGAQLLAPGTRQAGIVSFTHDTVPADRIRDGLAAAGVTGWAAWGSHTPLHLAANGVDRFVRLSVHHYTTPADVAFAARALRRTAAG